VTRVLIDLPSVLCLRDEHDATLTLSVEERVPEILVLAHPKGVRLDADAMRQVARWLSAAVDRTSGPTLITGPGPHSVREYELDEWRELDPERKKP